MIYTLTLSPALDYSLGVKDFRLGAINRSFKEEYTPGGKGINVSIVLNRLGYHSVALGFLAGFTGDYIESRLKGEGIAVDFVKTSGISRVNVKIECQQETAINAEGPKISKDEMSSLLSKLDALSDGDILVMSGQIPPALPPDTYENILSRLIGKKILSVVDSTGRLLTDSLAYHPFLIKPNADELAEVAGRPLHNVADIVAAARQLQQEGARNVLVSRGGEGAVLVDENGVVHAKPALKGHAISTVGAGDSMVAGFLAGYLADKDYEKAFELGLSSGSATAFSKGLATKAKVDEIMKTMYGVADVKKGKAI